MQDTSLAAWEEIQSALPSLAARAYRYIVCSRDHGATCEEVEKALHMKHQTASARMCDLTRRFKDDTPMQIVDSGERRATDSGRMAIVWKAVNR